MPDWTKSMQQTFEYFAVDPNTWSDMYQLDTIKKSKITRDLSESTLGSAELVSTDIFPEMYVRTYLKTIQNGVIERIPLGTHLIQSPASSFDGKVNEVNIEAYTSLIELKENQPPLGYSILKDQNIMKNAYILINENCRAPVVETLSDKTLYRDFVANTDDNWLSFNSDLISNASYHYDIDEYGRILFAPNQNFQSLQPVWVYEDNNSSILYPEFDIDHDMYGIPNVVEVVYSDSSSTYYSKVENNDSGSPTSIQNRGRRITYRETNPSLTGGVSQNLIDKYANDLLKSLSSIEYTITYSHGYCPVRVGDCVLLNYSLAGYKNVKAKVISQTIECSSGCKVTEKAIITNKLWG